MDICLHFNKHFWVLVLKAFIRVISYNSFYNIIKSGYFFHHLRSAVYLLGIVLNALPVLTHFYMNLIILLFLFMNGDSGTEGEVSCLRFQSGKWHSLSPETPK